MVQSSEGLLYLGFNSSGFRSGSNQRQWIRRLSHSLFFLPYAAPPLSYSPLFFTSVFICSLQICQFLLSSASGFALSLIPSEGDVSPHSLHCKKRACFHQVGFLLGCFCILIKILCVFAWVCGLTTYYRNSRGALAITSARLCVLQMWSADDLLKPKFFHQQRERASSEGWGKQELTRIGEAAKRDALKHNGESWEENRHLGDKITSLIEATRRKRKSSISKWKEKRQ